MVFTDDFSSTCNLAQVDDATHKYGCTGGEYVMLFKDADDGGWVWYSSQQYDDAVLEVDAHAIGNSDGEYGFIFRRDGNGNIYVFTVTTTGKYSLALYNQKKWSDLIGWTASPAIKTGSATNHLKVIAQGNQLALFVNDQPLDTVTDGTLAKGFAGLYFGNGNASSSVAFDNVKISKINRPLTLPAPKQRPPTPTPMPTIPPGMGGLIVTNFYGFEMNYDIGGKLYKIPGNSKQIITLAPGKYSYSADIPGRGRAGGTIEIQLGVYTTQSWAD